MRRIRKGQGNLAGSTGRSPDETLDFRDLSQRFDDLLSEALRLEESACKKGDTQAADRIAAFIAGIAAVESATFDPNEARRRGVEAANKTLADIRRAQQDDALRLIDIRRQH